MAENIVNESDEYICSDCGKEVKTKDNMCPHCGAPFDKPIKITKDFELNKLNDFSKEVYNKIISRHPEWKSYVTHDEELLKFVAIYIPSPVSNNLFIDILTMEGEEDEITIYFGPPHIHVPMYKPFKRHTVDNQIEDAEEIIQKIFNEEIILARTRSWFFVNPNFSWLSPDKYNSFIKKNKIYNAISWNGNFVYPENKMNLDWIPERFPDE
ncbi:MAG: zinc ribbon domain-containing protein [Ignavibacteria bacterium]|nr:zinc ribbon domain-containing protein [Ignavibacteria bacterium]